jgi:uncharacterized protein DUF4190
MSSTPPGQLSDDGKWSWDGTKWVPAQATQALAQPAAYPSAYPPAIVVRAAPTNSLAVVSLISGILSWVLCPVIGGIVAVVSGHSARSQIKTSGEAGGGLAIAGLVLGYISLGLVALALLFWLILLGGLAVIGAIGSSGH